MLPITEIYAAAPALVYAGAFILGLIVGSFLNVVIYRVPKMMHNEWKQECFEYMQQAKPELSLTFEPGKRFNLITPNSTCPHCNASIKPWQNVPVISYLLLKGKCGSCKAPISSRYPIIEFVTGLLTILPAFMFGATSEAWFGIVLMWCLIALTMIDIDHQLLPDSITLPLLWLGLLVNIGGVYTSLDSAVIGAIAGYLSLWSVYWLFKLATGKEGMGFGDFKLLAALGAWMGWTYLPLIIILSSLVGAAIGIGSILLAGRDKAKPMPFGPYLAIAGGIAFFWGEPILKNYLQMFAV